MSASTTHRWLRTAVVMFAACSMWNAAIADEASSGTADQPFEATVQRMMRQSFTSATPEQWKERIEQDEVQKLCSRYRNQPPPEVAQRIIALSSREFDYPASGKLMGDWKNGEKLASSGKGGHIGNIRPDPPGRKRGANCYACHALAPSELAAGNLGPGLTGYGILYGTSPETLKRVYQKIYNAQAFYACSQMPRFGYNNWLTPEEIADAVAYLLDPESPVNK
jgi:sulfur-oxidizing protein SoxX